MRDVGSKGRGWGRERERCWEQGARTTVLDEGEREGRGSQARGSGSRARGEGMDVDWPNHAPRQ